MTGQEVPILVFCHDITSISLVSLHNKTSHHSRGTSQDTCLHVTFIKLTAKYTHITKKNFWQIRSFILNFFNNTIYRVFPAKRTQE